MGVQRPRHRERAPGILVQVSASLVPTVLAALAPCFPGSSGLADLTVGVEHELFLYRDREPCDHEASQRFFAALAAGCEGTGVHERDPGLGDYVSAVLIPSSAGCPIEIKYEHHPHLIEIAIGPFGTVNDLHAEIQRAIDLVDTASAAVGLTRGRHPFLESPFADYATWSAHGLGRALRAYRTVELRRKGGDLTDTFLLNFSAYIAATQVHVGGVSWSRLPALVGWLYGVEPWVSSDVYRLLPEAFRDPERRWRGYLGCLGHLPLVGFPPGAEWTLDTWAAHLAAMPPLGDAARGSAVETIRDLQLVKPRALGTIEFRGDPSLPTARDIAAATALRLGLCVAGLSGENALAARPYASARRSWIDMVTRSTLCDDPGLRHLARWGLARREAGEERWLPGV